jgi:hypothetical protein
MQNEIRPRVTLTKTYPMHQWETQVSPAKKLPKEKTFAEKKQEIKDKALLKHLQQRYDEAFFEKKDKPLDSASTNDNLVRN